MLGLVLAGNVAMVFVFWELVGICSYFLIGFYIERKSASNAANKAFIVNRIGDFGMLIGLMAMWGAWVLSHFGDVDVNHNQSIEKRSGYFLSGPPGGRQTACPECTAESRSMLSADAERIKPRCRDGVRQHGAALRLWLMVVAGVGIFCGCVGKSAQFPLHVWLPDAMEGPTPVSALVHSATMVAAGVYLVGRFYPFFLPEVLLVIAVIGVITLFMAATIAITATDIKRVLAYSTVSQLGYMMLALGLGGWLAGMLHLVTHAFFKSLLFLCSGSVIHAVHYQRDDRDGRLAQEDADYRLHDADRLPGDLRMAIPFIIGLSGYYSKDLILEQAFTFWKFNHTIWGGFFFYRRRWCRHHGLLYVPSVVHDVRRQTARPHRYEHAHESPKVMTIPLIFWRCSPRASPGPFAAITLQQDCWNKRGRWARRQMHGPVGAA